jgi:hypothetical protein
MREGARDGAQGRGSPRLRVPPLGVLELMADESLVGPHRLRQLAATAAS